MLAIIILPLGGCIQQGIDEDEEKLEEVIQMEVRSAAFEHNQQIPQKYTCDGEDVSPPLTFVGLPTETKSLALIVDDPDAPMGVFDHWIVWNIDPSIRELTEGITIGISGRNDFGELRYRGPCPPSGPAHRYRFKVYALDAMLQLPEGSSKRQLEEAMEGHILAEGELVGTYKR